LQKISTFAFNKNKNVDIERVFSSCALFYSPKVLILSFGKHRPESEIDFVLNLDPDRPRIDDSKLRREIVNLILLFCKEHDFRPKIIVDLRGVRGVRQRGFIRILKKRILSFTYL